MSTTTGSEKRQTAGKTSWNKTKTVTVVIAIIAILFLARAMKNGNGSQREQPQAGMPIVVTQEVIEADLAAEREYVGRVDPIQAVSLRAQVNGEIERVHFQEGAEVKAGQLLFSIDSKLYAAAVEARKADLAQAEANLDRAEKYFKRLKTADQRSVSAATLEAAESEMLQGRAAVGQAKAALSTARINLGYTRITAPISGRAGKALLTKGNYATPAAELTTIVQTDPVRVTFTLPDKDYINQLEQFKNSRSDVFNATVRLANGKEYPEKGVRDFENNKIDPATGTMMLSLRYGNPAGLLIPGSMVRVAVKPVKTHTAPVIPQAAVMADSQGDFIYIVDSENKVHQRRVRLGINYGVMSEVISGVSAGEMVITRGIQSVRDGIEVKQVPARAEGETPSAAEEAKKSGFDLTPVSRDGTAAEKTESDEGKN